MRLFTLFYLFSFASFPLLAQNLVPNPSFEDTVACPVGGDQLFKAQHWSAFRFSPDYFHSCCNLINNSVVGVPSNDLGYQFAHSGNAYAGIITYDLTGAPYREYLGVLLSNSLNIGTKYYLSFYLNWSGKLGFTIATNKFGAVITDSLFTPNNPYPITNTPIVFSNSIIADSLNWIQIKLEFFANSNANYLVLGNFFDDINTDTLNMGLFNQHAYYYIDDVCLSIDSNLCYSFTNNDELINLSDQENIIRKYYYLEDKLNLKFNDSFKNKKILLFSGIGELLYNTDTYDDEIVIHCKNDNLLLFVLVYSENKTQTLKLLR